MTPTSLSALTSTLVARPFGSNPLVPRDTQANWDFRFKLANNEKNHPKKLPPLSAEQVKANIEHDKKQKILIRESGFGAFGLKITDDCYIFNPSKYKEIFGKLPNWAEFKQRYGLPDEIIKEQLGEDCPGNKDEYKANRSVKIPTKYIDIAK